jgi:hypothetical protein
MICTQRVVFLLAHVVFQKKLLLIFFDCDRYAAVRNTLLTFTAVLRGTRWLNAAKGTRLK